MGLVYLIADLHFGGESIIRYENRPFQSVDEMEQVLITRWNGIVNCDDTVYVLGDFSSDQDAEKDKRILEKLNGMKILIMGNHDSHRTPEEWRAIGFAECSPWPIIYKEFFMLSHEPLYLNRNMPYANIYGHVHGNVTYQSITEQSACVSVERIHYTPVAFDVLIEEMKKCVQV